MTASTRSVLSLIWKLVVAIVVAVVGLNLLTMPMLFNCHDPPLPTDIPDCSRRALTAFVTGACLLLAALVAGATATLRWRRANPP